MIISIIVLTAILIAAQLILSIKQIKKAPGWQDALNYNNCILSYMDSLKCVQTNLQPDAS